MSLAGCGIKTSSRVVLISTLSTCKYIYILPGNLLSKNPKHQNKNRGLPGTIVHFTFLHLL